MADQPETAGAKHARESVIDLAARVVHEVVSKELGTTPDTVPHPTDLVAVQALARRGLLVPVELFEERAIPTPTGELLDAAAERGHNAMFEGELPAEGIERALWHKVALAVLDDPRLLPAWARGARVDADNWRRQCSALDAELEEWRSQVDHRKAGWVMSRVREALGTPDGRAVSVHAAEVRAERDLLLWLHAEAVHFGEGWNEQWLAARRTAGFAMRRMNEFADARDQLKARIDRLRFEIENTTLPVGALQQMSDAVNLTHPVSEEDKDIDVPHTELRARRAMDLVYDWLRTIRAIPATLQGDQPANLVTFLAPIDWRDQLDGADPVRLFETWIVGAPTEPAPPLERADDAPSRVGTSPSAVDSGEAVAKVGGPECICAGGRCDYDDHDNPLTGDECLACAQLTDTSTCPAYEGDYVPGPPEEVPGD